jgi:hypothetical protein
MDACSFSVFDSNLSGEAPSITQFSNEQDVQKFQINAIPYRRCHAPSPEHYRFQTEGISSFVFPTCEEIMTGRYFLGE